MTFNYDILVEDALRKLKIPLASITDYIQGEPFKLFKLHGSVGWAREVATQTNLRKLNVDDRVQALIEQARDIRGLLPSFRLVNGDCLNWPLVNRADSAEIPALAIPFIQKEEYECPPDHVRILQELVPQTTRVRSPYYAYGSS